jgi:hypothetical protein
MIMEREFKMKISIKQVLVIIATLVMLTVNALANILPINGMNTGQVSDSFKVFFVPAGYVFSIWGVIYLLLLGFTVYQALPAQKDNPILNKISPWYIIGSLANAIWIFLWHYLQFNLTILFMGILLISLLVIYVALRNNNAAKISTGMKWFVQLPFSVYLGWISVATIANVTDVLDFNNWNGFGIGAETWALIMLGVGVVLAAWMTLKFRDAAYLAVFVWAFAGIGVKFAGTSIVSSGAYIAAAVVAVLLLVSLVDNVKRKTI